MCFLTGNPLKGFLSDFVEFDHNEGDYNFTKNFTIYLNGVTTVSVASSPLPVFLSSSI